MARTCVRIPYQCTAEAAQDRIEAYLMRSRFKKVTNKYGEEVWKYGQGIASAIRYFKLEFEPDNIVLYAWVAGIGFGRRSAMELNLEGFYAANVKRNMRKIIREIQSIFV